MTVLLTIGEWKLTDTLAITHLTPDNLQHIGVYIYHIGDNPRCNTCRKPIPIDIFNKFSQIRELMRPK